MPFKRGDQSDHWESTTRLRPGDTVIHYAKGAVRAVSTVTDTATKAQRPVPLPESWFNDGRIAHVKISRANVPVSLDSIPERLRLAETSGPFDLQGNVRQIYLLPVPDKFASTFFDMFGARFDRTLRRH